MPSLIAPTGSVNPTNFATYTRAILTMLGKSSFTSPLEMNGIYVTFSAPTADEAVAQATESAQRVHGLGYRCEVHSATKTPGTWWEAVVWVDYTR